MYRDPELPAGLQDADFEMRGLEALGRRASALKRRGLCAHGWSQRQSDGSVKCLDCGAMFASESAHHAAYKEALGL